MAKVFNSRRSLFLSLLLAGVLGCKVKDGHHSSEIHSPIVSSAPWSPKQTVTFTRVYILEPQESLNLAGGSGGGAAASAAAAEVGKVESKIVHAVASAKKSLEKLRLLKEQKYEVDIKRPPLLDRSESGSDLSSLPERTFTPPSRAPSRAQSVFERTDSFFDCISRPETPIVHALDEIKPEGLIEGRSVALVDDSAGLVPKEHVLASFNHDLKVISVPPLPAAGRTVLLGNQLGKGSEGFVYEVAGDFQNGLVAKLYKGKHEDTFIDPLDSPEVKIFEGLKSKEISVDALVRYEGVGFLANGKKVALFERMDQDLAQLIRSQRVPWSPKATRELILGFKEVSKFIKLYDVKPQNFLVRAEGQNLVIKFSDIAPNIGSVPYRGFGKGMEGRAIGALGMSLLEWRNGRVLIDVIDDWKDSRVFFDDLAQIEKTKPLGVDGLEERGMPNVQKLKAGRKILDKCADNAEACWKNDFFVVRSEEDIAIVRGYLGDEAVPQDLTVGSVVEQMPKLKTLSSVRDEKSLTLAPFAKRFMLGQSYKLRPQPDGYDALLHDMVLGKYEKIDPVIQALDKL